MVNLFSIGIFGFNVVQVVFNMVGNNIINVGIDGYSCEVVCQVECVVLLLNCFIVGNGVDVVVVECVYFSYFISVVWSSNVNFLCVIIYNDLVIMFNSMFSVSGDLQGVLDNFYGVFDIVVNVLVVGDMFVWQVLLGNVFIVVLVFIMFGVQLDSQQKQINGQIINIVKSINIMLDNIVSFNCKIYDSFGSGMLNVLLDQCDVLVNSLFGYFGVIVVSEVDGIYSVYSSSGQSLVSGSYVFKLFIGSDLYDMVWVNVLDSSGGDIILCISGGLFGVLFDYCSNVLDSVQNCFGQVVIGLVISVNVQQGKGLDFNGQFGKLIFVLFVLQVLFVVSNVGMVIVVVQVMDVVVLDSVDYMLCYDGSVWSMIIIGGQLVVFIINFDGLFSGVGFILVVFGVVQVGDSFCIQLICNVVSGLMVSFIDLFGIVVVVVL